jgi:hypothetical protein
VKDAPGALPQLHVPHLAVPAPAHAAALPPRSGMKAAQPVPPAKKGANGGGGFQKF